MAWAPKDDNIDETTGLPYGAPGAETIDGGSANPGGPSPKSPAQSNPGAFVGIQQYLDANKPQSQKLAQTVGDSVTAQGDAARNAIVQGQGSFNQDVAAGTTSFDTDLGNKVQNNAETLNDADKSKFKQEQTAQYSGPNSFQESAYYQPTKNAVTAATRAAANTMPYGGNKDHSATVGADDGLRQLLNPIENKAKHGTTQGIGTFDTALLQAAPNSRTALAQARQNVSDVDPKLQKLLADALSGATAAKATTKNTVSSANQALQSGVGALNTALPQNYNTFNTGATDYNTKMAALAKQFSDPMQKQNLSNADSQSIASFLGIPADQPLYGVKDFQNYLKTPSPTSLSQFASPEEAARYAALQDLGGQFDFSLDPSLAGTAGTGHVTADTAGLKQALSDGQGSYDYAQKLADSLASLGEKQPYTQELPGGPVVFDPNVAAPTNPYASEVDTGPGITKASGGVTGGVAPASAPTPTPQGPPTGLVASSLSPGAKINFGNLLPSNMSPMEWKNDGGGVWTYTGPVSLGTTASKASVAQSPGPPKQISKAVLNKSVGRRI